MNWADFFHQIVIPIVSGLVLTIGKAIAEHRKRALSLDDSNDVALDLVLIGVGALAAFQIDAAAAATLLNTTRAIYATLDAGVGDALLAIILLYLRYERYSRGAGAGGKLPKISTASGIGQLILGAAAVIWTIKTF